MNRIAVWLVRQLLWPVLSEVLSNLLTLALREAFAFMRIRIARWRTQQEEGATSDAEFAAIRRAYDERAADLDDAEAHLVRSVQRIVNEALVRAESERDRLLSAGPPVRALEAGDAQPRPESNSNRPGPDA